MTQFSLEKKTMPIDIYSLREKIRANYQADEEKVVDTLLSQSQSLANYSQKAQETAKTLVQTVRDDRRERKGIRAFLQEYKLSSEEGVVLLCLAEALLRIPDQHTVDLLIKDKLVRADWQKHIGQSPSFFVNAASWGLMVTGNLLKKPDLESDSESGLWHHLGEVWKKLLAKSGQPFIRQAIKTAIQVLGQQFIMGHHIGSSLKRAKKFEKQGYRYSYDMLGEAARTMADAKRYRLSYEQAIHTVAKAVHGKDYRTAPGISVKLSALHPRYEISQAKSVTQALMPVLMDLCRQAKAAHIGLTFDAEEADRLELSLDLIANLIHAPEIKDWGGLGLAVQAYQKRAIPVIDWIIGQCRAAGRKMMVRLVKGAYWDTEIKRAQEKGLPDYPVYTHKASTDLSYLLCAQKLLNSRDFIFPQFATHNAHTVAFILEMAGLENRESYEFQRLQGMGEGLYEALRHQWPGIGVRIYAPVGSHQDLLPYLVRRMLENGANTSFVNRILDKQVNIVDLIQDPVGIVEAWRYKRNMKIPLPKNIFGSDRLNSQGIDLSDPLVIAQIEKEIAEFSQKSFYCHAGYKRPVFESGHRLSIRNPATQDIVGDVWPATEQQITQALASSQAAQLEWDLLKGDKRAQYLELAADQLEENRASLLSLLVREAGKTLPDAISELREAVDFCRYYAGQARLHFQNPQLMPGPTGERNQLFLHGRGVFIAISPWNFPLAIFIGQITAALAAGNTVIAKPAEQTPLIAALAIQLLHQAGIPQAVLQLIPGDGKIGARLVEDPSIAGVVFTGSTTTAQVINRSLATKTGAIIPLIAETGGLNAMIVDSSALIEQVVRDLVISAFQSAGQRCSACRIVFIQEDLAERLKEMLVGAMAELKIGNPADLSTDIGPVIDADALVNLQQHVNYLQTGARILYSCPLSKQLVNGYFFPPTLAELTDASLLKQEVFGPILHVVSWRNGDLDQVIEWINKMGYGLTLGIHSRLDQTIKYIQERCHVGNIYVNRSMIGAVVGVHPFGGEGLSGTGPKAGGPHYLFRFATERLLSVDVTAAGGNTSLLSMNEESN